MNANPVAEVRLQLNTMAEQFAAVLPKHIPVERFCRIVVTAVQLNRDLLGVDRQSLLSAAMKAAQDGLMPDGRFGAIIPFNDKRKGKIAQWLPMIAGIRQKVRNSGEIAAWDVAVVHERDLFDYELGDNPHILHKPVRGDAGKIIAAYSIAIFRSGEKSRDVMWIEEIEKTRQTSKAPDSPAWTQWYGEMCKKTVAKRHAKVLPMSSDLDDLLRRDDDDHHDGGEPNRGGGASEPRRTLASALNAIAGLPETEAPRTDQIPADEYDADGVVQGELIEHEKEPAK